MKEFVVILILDIFGCVSINVHSIVCEAIGLGEYGCPYYVIWYGIWW